ncbi:788_t:CDS:1 [Diversispora eburnea]|uniref:788_t:CDS:1 n=1 Tax=Diversispora eburnea TaxID=1213867 RepID=A0A9N8ZMU6_9GLOM|nr:788_t:CDS:1 [Diversispora eburnea]
MVEVQQSDVPELKPPSQELETQFCLHSTIGRSIHRPAPQQYISASGYEEAINFPSNGSNNRMSRTETSLSRIGNTILPTYYDRRKPTPQQSEITYNTTLRHIHENSYFNATEASSSSSIMLIWTRLNTAAIHTLEIYDCPDFIYF